MHISLAGFVLFLHIGVAILAFMIAGVLHSALHAMARARTVAQLRPFAALVHRLEPLLPIAAVLLLGLGAWLIHLSAGEFSWSDGWVLTAVTTLVLVEGLAGAALAPRTKKLIQMIESAPDGEVPLQLRRAVLDPVVWDIAHIATVGFLGLVFLMAAKPSGAFSVPLVVVAAAVGVALSRWQLAKVPQVSSEVPGQRASADATTGMPARAEQH